MPNVFKQRDKSRVEWKQADGPDKCLSTSAKKVIEKMRGLLAQAHDTILQLKKDHEEQLAVEKERSDALKIQATDLRGQVVKSEGLPRISRSKKRMAFAEVKTLNALRHNVLVHLRALRSKMPGCLACVTE